MSRVESRSHRPGTGLFSRLRGELAVLRDYRGGDGRGLRYPRYLFCEVSNHCNLDCLQCIRSLMRRPRGNMSMDLFRKIAVEAGPHVDVMDLNMWGEPLFNPRLDEMIACAKESGVAEVLVNTNALLMDEQWAERLLRSPLDTLVFSLDAATAGTYGRIRRKGDYDTAVKNVRAYFDLRKRLKVRGPHTVAQMIVMRENRQEARAFRDMWRGTADTVFLRPLASMGDPKGVFEEQRVFGPTDGRRTVCYNPWNALCVFWDGRAAFCNDDINLEHPIGDVNDRSVYEVWTSPAMRAIRDGLRNGRLPGCCENCSEWAMSRPPTLWRNLALAVMPKRLAMRIKLLAMRRNSGDYLC